jgi:hypothetical protein
MIPQINNANKMALKNKIVPGRNLVTPVSLRNATCSTRYSDHLRGPCSKDRLTVILKGTVQVPLQRDPDARINK